MKPVIIQHIMRRMKNTVPTPNNDTNTNVKRKDRTGTILLMAGIVIALFILLG